MAIFNLCSGSSDTYDLCKNKVDFYWTEHEIDRTEWYLDETYENRELPINEGTVNINAISRIFANEKRTKIA